jgi:hypothetical protein
MTNLSNRNASRARRSIYVVMGLASVALGCTTEAPAGSAGQGDTTQPLTGPVFADPTGGVGNQVSSSPTFCDAMLVMKGACHECHGAARQFGAPMSLATYQDMIAPAVTRPDLKVYQLVSQRIHDTVRPMPELPRMLTAPQMATLDGWIAAGALPGVDPTCAAPPDTNTLTGGTGGAAPVAGEGGSGGEVIATGGTGGGTTGEFVWPEDCEEFHTFTAYAGSNKGTPANIAGNSESHPQFYFDVPWSGEVQALAFRSITDNTKVIHHWIMYGPGSGGLGGDKFLVGWAPGKDEKTPLPDDVGMYMPGSGQLRLDVHYNNKGTDSVAETDASGVEVCVTHTFRKYTATVMGLTGDATAPAGQTKTNTSTCTANVTGSEPVRILSVSPHMHKLGVHAFFSQTSGGTEVIHHDAAFNFENQQVHALDNVIVKDNDRLTTACTYTNPTNSTVSFGQDTSDEMCFNFITYYPMGAMSCGLTL